MPTLSWIGKEKVVNYHNEVPYRILEQKYSYGDDENGNMIIHGDNLEALKALLQEFEGKVRCIYIDPPYNTGNEKWIYNDNVTLALMCNIFVLHQLLSLYSFSEYCVHYSGFLPYVVLSEDLIHHTPFYQLWDF